MSGVWASAVDAGTAGVAHSVRLFAVTLASAVPFAGCAARGTECGTSPLAAQGCAVGEKVPQGNQGRACPDAQAITVSKPVDTRSSS